MLKTLKVAASSMLAVCAVVAAPASRADTEQQNLVERSRQVLDDLKTDKEFGNAKQLLANAKAVLIIPGLVKGGFFIGGEGGDGVLLKRGSAAAWSNPAFYTVASASFGLQIGLQKSEVMLFVMNEKALHALMKNEVKLGAQAGLSVVTLGAAVQGAVTTNGGADIIAWSSSTGAYGGLTLEGSMVKPRDSYNQAYYGQSSVNPILAPGPVNPGAKRLVGELDGLTG